VRRRGKPACGDREVAKHHRWEKQIKFISRIAFALVAGGVLSSLTATASRAQILTNGSFETPNVSGGIITFNAGSSV